MYRNVVNVDADILRAQRSKNFFPPRREHLQIQTDRIKVPCRNYILAHRQAYTTRQILEMPRVVLRGNFAAARQIGIQLANCESPSAQAISVRR